MEYVKMDANLEMSRIIQGFWRVNDWKYSTDELYGFMLELLDLVINTFDTAEIYDDGKVEMTMGDVFKKYPEIRSKINIISKTGIYKQVVNGNDFGYYDTTYDRIIKSCEESLERLGVSYIDLYLIHREDPLINHKEVAKALSHLIEKGYVKNVGVSNFDPMKFEALNTEIEKRNHKLITNQIEWNPFCFEHFKSGMMDYLSIKQVHPMIWSPLAGGRLFDKKDDETYQVNAILEELAKKYDTSISTIVFAWILKHPLKCLPLVGSGKIEWVKDAVNALDIEMDQWDWFRIYSASGEMEIR